MFRKPAVHVAKLHHQQQSVTQIPIVIKMAVLWSFTFATQTVSVC